MKKLLILIPMLILLVGCRTQNNPDGATTQNQNVVVQSPKINEVTCEISEKLVGKYYVKDDPETYFEIKPDGTAEISLNTLDGYAKINADDLRLALFYDDPALRDLSGLDMSEIDIDSAIKTVSINFNLIRGEWRFPTTYGLSLCFWGRLERDANGSIYCNSFSSATYFLEDGLKFVKQK